MPAVIQRVTEASDEVDGRIVGSIGKGLLILLGIRSGDTQAESAYLAQWLHADE